jgi:PhoH-like ATPase
MSDQRVVIIDTSVLLAHGRQPLFGFPGAEVVLPLVVLEELESKRNDPELGLTARSALRALEGLRTLPGAELWAGVEVDDEGGTVRIETNHVQTSKLPEAMRNNPSHDTRILAVANAFKTEGQDVTVYTKDLPMRIKAHGVLGIPAFDYAPDAPADFGYTGIERIDIAQELIDRLHKDKVVRNPGITGIPDNTALVLSNGGPSSSTIAILDRGGARLSLIPQGLEAWGVSGKSLEQRVALAHLLNEDIRLVSLGGPAGTGKTLLSLAAAIQLALEQNKYKKILVFRPLYAVGGQELGFLPGSEAEKMDPWAAAIYDALESIGSPESITELKARDMLKILPLTHIRGRTLSDSFVIVDEAQNLEMSVILTALTRIGAGSKVVMCWDVAQRDNLLVGRHDGVHAVVQQLCGQDLFAHVTLTKSERSPVASMVARLLDDLIA